MKASRRHGADAGGARSAQWLEREQFGHYARSTMIDMQDFAAWHDSRRGCWWTWSARSGEQQQAQQQPAAAWAMDDADDDGAGVRYYE